MATKESLNLIMGMVSDDDAIQIPFGADADDVRDWKITPEVGLDAGIEAKIDLRLARKELHVQQNVGHPKNYSYLKLGHRE